MRPGSARICSIQILVYFRAYIIKKPEYEHELRPSSARICNIQILVYFRAYIIKKPEYEHELRPGSAWWKALIK